MGENLVTRKKKRKESGGRILWEVRKTDLGLTSAFDILSRRLSASCGPQGLETCSGLSSNLSVQVRTWTAALQGGSLFFFPDIHKKHGRRDFSQQRVWFHLRPSGMCESLSSTFYPFWKCDSLVACFFLTFPRSVLPREVTCESDQFNPDRQLCLTYFRFGALGFLAFAFVRTVLAAKHAAHAWGLTCNGSNANVAAYAAAELSSPAPLHIHSRQTTPLSFMCLAQG